MVKTGSSALMSVKSIFQQLHNPTTWPAPPERPLRPYSADFAAGVLVPKPVETLRRWTAVAKAESSSSLTERHACRPDLVRIHDVDDRQRNDFDHAAGCPK